ncbi:Potassium uptake protein TrkH [Anaerovibrio sp. JC8]|uniref:TrkH family potassium uptake protein n=1 Tax=Anaerovibrio sp. JC8 TaxID=1240085 RepID=UPI000A0DD5FA|nr:potassium transporter TrkG [Anaerovibrio sp. JC8]ORU01111.1 Potassium uptake protein TrkH [Anaerovibrio sp. JC8]
MDKLILFLLGRALLLCSGCMAVPFAYSIYLHHNFMTGVFGQSIFVTLLLAVFLIKKSTNPPESLSVYGGTIFLCAIWVAVALCGGLPYYLSNSLGAVDSFVESMSGFTTTGYTNILYLKDPALILWRSMTQWIGGGMILMFIATVLPAITGMFGTSFAMPVALKTGIVTINRLKKNTRRLFVLYGILSLIGVFFFSIAGLGTYDAINFAMVTISTGGCYFSDAYLYNNIWFASAAIVGLIAAGGNVIIYWQAIKRRQYSMLKKTIHNSEFHIFLLIILVIGLICGLHLYHNNYYSLSDSLLYGFFSVALYAGTTGAPPSEVLTWTDFDKMLLIVVASIGGCIGSLAGGFKILRLMILFKSCANEMTRTIHPDIIMTMKIDGDVVPSKVINRILGFFFMVIVTIAFSILVISAAGLDMQQSMDIVLACITSTGPIMLFHTSHSELLALPVIVKLFCCFLMVLGKLDIFAFLILIFGSRQQLLHKHW